MGKEQLTESNYHTPASNMEYVSHSQIIDFCGTLGRKGCECKGLAKARGEWKEPMTTALMVGSYVDAALTGDLEKFIADHPEIISSRGATKGELKTDYQNANVMIERAKREALFMRYLDGDKQRIMTGEVCGVPVKIKIDSTDDKRITDLKTCKNLSDVFYAKDLDQHLNVVEYWGWDIEAALYVEVYRQNTGKTLPFYLAAITKETENSVPHPRVAVIQITDSMIESGMKFIESNIRKIQAIKTGEIEPIPCGTCSWCADNLPLTEVISSDELLLEV